MRKVIYLVKIPKPDKKEEYEELTFNKTEEVCEKMGISVTTLYSIINKKLKYNHVDKKHLEGIIIEKIIQEPKKKQKPDCTKSKKSKEEIEESKKDFQTKLIELNTK